MCCELYSVFLNKHTNLYA